MAQSISRSVETFIATIVAALLKVLPDGVSVAVREKLTLQRPMDYADAVISLRVTSRTEKDVRLRSCEKEPETVDWIRDTVKAGDVLYDIGANVGAYSLIVAHWTHGKALVYAFEPGYSTFPNLVDNIFINKCEGSVIPFPLALAAETAVRGFQYATAEPGAAAHRGLTDARGNDDGRTQLLVSYRLDEFVTRFGLQPPTHLKIDVDGGELDVLLGAPDTLTLPRLAWVLVEVDVTSPQTTSVKRLLEECGFRLDGDHAHYGGITHNWIFRRVASPTSQDGGEALAEGGSRSGQTDVARGQESWPPRSER